MRKLSKKNKIFLITAIAVILCAAITVIIVLSKSADNAGWKTEGDNTYYVLNEDKELAIGICEIDGNTYCFDTNGALLTGWIDLDGKKYYALADGVLTSGLTEIDGSSYVFRFDDKSLIYGWSNVYGDRYYSDDSGIVQTGFIILDEGKYYFDESGKLVTGSFTTADGSYLADSSGILLSGLVDTDDCTYLLDEDGLAISGWQDVNGEKMYFTSTGQAANGIIDIDGESYIFSNGIYLTGWQSYNGNEYYLYKNGKMAKNTEVGVYAIGSDGIAIMEECNLENLNEYLDFYLDKYGREPQNIYDAVHDNMSYKFEDKTDSYEDMACYAINNGKGACYHYAAFGYLLFKRAGYEVYVVEGVNGRTGNEHMWLYVHMDDGWFYVDPVYNAGAKMTEEYLISNGSEWDSDSLPKD